MSAFSIFKDKKKQNISIQTSLPLEFITNKKSEVEEILKKDPAEIYSKMTYKTKEYYRNKIKEL